MDVSDSEQKKMRALAIWVTEEERLKSSQSRKHAHQFPFFGKFFRNKPFMDSSDSELLEQT